ncbi:MAG: HAD-IA family hydrolase [Treponema sp.]|jgi:putative hydrolase of the HAD superfamily|nr:HAD-IA family hydrolase [Treponema sp.]
MITHILFDLDNTLYSARFALEEATSRRIRAFTSEWLGVSPEEASAMRRAAMKNYGTTAEWLAAEKGLKDISAYYRIVHPEDEADSLFPDPALRPFLESLPCPLAILTNSPLFHARRILGKLGIEDLFFRIFDIEESGFRGKPRPESYRHALDVLGAEPGTVLFVDDAPGYVEGYLALEKDAKGVLFDESGLYPDYPGERIGRLEELRTYLAPPVVH